MLYFMQKNQQRGRDSKPPVTYQDCMAIATNVLAKNKVDNGNFIHNMNDFI